MELGKALRETIDWIIRSPRAWVILTCLGVYVRTSFVKPDAGVLAVTGGSVVLAIASHVWSEAQNNVGHQ